MFHASGASARPLRIVHILRSPVGGLFRHVLDLARAQVERGHAVGLIADSSTGGARADAALAAIEPVLTLGVERLPMRRDPHPADVAAMARISRMIRRMDPEVVHGHGAKGALYARLPGLLPFASGRRVRIYTPHGGSLHYDSGSLKGAAILSMERLLARAADLILFESIYAAERFQDTIGVARCPMRVVHNGLHLDEFSPVRPGEAATDFLFVGELRELKGVDVLLQALARLPATGAGHLPGLTLVGAGPDRAAFEALADTLGLSGRVTFRDPMPAREAFTLGQVLVVPSRAESLPYIVLEAAAAQVPLVASRVGGIPEILGGDEHALVPPADVAALATALQRQLATSGERRRSAAASLARSLQTRFSVDHMTDSVIEGYREAMADRLRSTRRVGRQPTWHSVSRFGH